MYLFPSIHFRIFPYVIRLKITSSRIAEVLKWNFYDHSRMPHGGSLKISRPLPSHISTTMKKKFYKAPPRSRSRLKIGAQGLFLIQQDDQNSFSIFQFLGFLSATQNLACRCKAFKCGNMKLSLALIFIKISLFLMDKS